ncbi:MAG: ATP-dependent RNA helicase [Treponema sp.]|jgi:HrpA-like RNA helicase|nr:ATP-dependent RNA helicase [Treponema sp.]
MNFLDLPVYQHKDLILNALKSNQAVVVESPTGSGKTTQLPVILYDALFAASGMIGVTQPRRIAALSVSGFIARQLGFAEAGMPGCPVGYKMRFEDKTAADTKIKIMTDGILLQEMKLDPWLSKYSVMVIDEAHERSLNIDFILGLLKRVMESRGEFKVIVSSATINAEVFSEYFGECPVVKIDAETFPVTLIYDPPVLRAPDENGARDGERGGRDGGNRGGNRDGRGAGNLAGEALLLKIETIIERFISEQREGDILVFLPGEKMIKDCMKALLFGPAGKNLHIIPLYGRLGKEEQERVFDGAPKGKTKVVISTNIAETSVTIDGITAVLDSGLSKLNYYNPRTFTSSLVESPISKASANQRKGRAGRTREGSCYRLYTRREFEGRPLFTTEEIYRSDLAEVVLRMADLGVTDYEEFDFISPPSREGIHAAIETLNLLDALEEDRSLSKIGKMMTEFPLPPRQSRIIVEAILRYPAVVKETVIAAAFLSTQNPYILPPGEELDARKAHHSFRDSRGDFVSYLKLYRGYLEAENKQKFCEKSYLDEKAMAEIANVTDQLEQIVSDMRIPVLSGGGAEDYLCCVGRGLIQFVCAREGRGMYRSLTADKIMIHPGSVMYRKAAVRDSDAAEPRFIVAGEIIRTTRMYAMSVSPLKRETVERISPLLLTELGCQNGETRGRSRPETERGTGERRKHDFTNNIRIAGENFPVETVKGKKHVKLPWRQLEKIRAKLAETAQEPKIGAAPAFNAASSLDPRQYKGMRGTIIVDDSYTLLAGEKLSLILALLDNLDLDGVLERDWPRRENFSSAEAAVLDRLLEELDLVLSPALSRRRKSFELGFIALFTDGEGNYWFRCSRGFHTALNESIASLEALIDELGDEVDPAKKYIVNQCYRRLSEYLNT